MILRPVSRCWGSSTIRRPDPAGAPASPSPRKPPLIAGHFGWHWGIVAGFVHSSAALSVGGVHAGLNLYNNGFAAGIVAAILAPVIIALRAGRDGGGAPPSVPASSPGAAISKG